MTITATALGTQSVQITLSGLDNTFIDFFLKVKNAITGTSPVATTGWELLDELDAGVIHTQVFRCLNKDNVTYKNIILRWNIHTLEINTSTCESWNATTHVATNEAHTFFNCAPVHFSLNACDLVIFVSPRWCAMISYINGEPCLWAGVFESAREDSSDTAAANYPCWGWMSAVHAAFGTTSITSTGKPLGGNDYTLWSMPRTRNGNTGINAAKKFSADYGVVAYPTWLQTNVQPFVYQLGNITNKFLANAWNQTGRLALPIKPIHDFDQPIITNYGTIFGAKICAPAGISMNKISLTTNSDGNFSPTGTTTHHRLLNHAHKPMVWDISAWFSNTGWVQSNVPVLSGLTPKFICSTGAAYYISTTSSNKVVKVDAISSTSLEIALPGVGVINDIKFDGERYVYIGHVSGISRLDTRDESITSVSIGTGGIQTMAISPTHVVCTPVTASLNPTVYRFARSGSFTVGAAVSIPTTLAEIGTLGEAVVNADGDVLLTALSITSTGQARIVKITAAGVASYSPSVGIICANTAIQLLDETNAILWQATTVGTISMTQFNPKTLTIGVTSNCTSSSALTTNFKMSAIKVAGCLIAIPRNSATANIVAIFHTGNNISGVLQTPVIGADIGPITGSVTNSVVFFDGARIIVGTSTGLRIYTNINGIYPVSATTLGQLAIPQ